MDFQTLFVAFSVVALTCSLSLALLALLFRDQPGSRSWAAGIMAVTVGLFCFVLYAEFSHPFFAGLGNFWQLLGMLLVVHGGREALGLGKWSQRTRWLSAAMAALVVLAIMLGTGSLQSASGGLSDGGWLGLRSYLSSLVFSLALMLAGGSSVWMILRRRVLSRRRYWAIYFAGCIALLLAGAGRLAGLLWIGVDAPESRLALSSAVFLIMVAAMITLTIGAIAITAGELYRELKRTSILDHQTELLNRRGFFELLGRGVFADSDGRPMSIIVADIDHFKAINDQHGHDVGDTVIAHLAAILRGGARKSDLVARFGGEEFVMALPRTGLEDARILAERLRECLNCIPVVVAGAGEIRFTASFGIAQQDGVLDFDALFRRADAALYEAKRAGRDRVVLARG